jgi:hypothetical protein
MDDCILYRQELDDMKQSITLASNAIRNAETAIRNAETAMDNKISFCFDPAPAGPVPGCMDSLATNFNPLATVGDGSCVMPVIITQDERCLNLWENAGRPSDWDQAAPGKYCFCGDLQTFGGLDCSEGGYGAQYCPVKCAQVADRCNEMARDGDLDCSRPSVAQMCVDQCNNEQFIVGGQRSSHPSITPYQCDQYGVCTSIPTGRRRPISLHGQTTPIENREVRLQQPTRR